MKNNKLEIEMKKLAEEYHFNLFNLQNNDERIPIYLKKREMIQNTLLKMNQEERLLIAFIFLYPEEKNIIEKRYQKHEYEIKKNLALVSFFHCLKQ